MDSDQRILSDAEWEAALTIPPHDVPNVFKIDDSTVAKTGLGEERAKSEVAAMELARERTSIPIPQVYNCYKVEKTQKWCILMELVEGQTLEEMWQQDSDEVTTASIVAELKTFLSELRNVKGSFIGSVDGSVCRDQFFDDDEEELWGPYNTVAEFHAALIKAMRAVRSNPWVDMVAGFVQSLPEHEIVFTHSDLAPRNIIVKDGKIAAILDWELAGYYPAHWEYVKANYLPDWDSRWIVDHIPDLILQPYRLEHAVHIHASRVILNW